VKVLSSKNAPVPILVQFRSNREFMPPSEVRRLDVEAICAHPVIAHVTLIDYEFIAGALRASPNVLFIETKIIRTRNG
jgi:hypothetical protein